MKRFLALFNFKGTIEPLQYLGTGVLAMLVKYMIDRQAAAWLVHVPWRPWNYLDPLGTTASLLTMTTADRRFLAIMSAIALPFAWLGLSLSIKRLRSLKAPLAFIIFFFVPFVNLLFFLMLSILPAPQPGKERKHLPGERFGDATLALLVSLPVCLGGIYMAAKFMIYGWGLFTAVPFCLGLTSVLVYSWRRPRRLGECMIVGLGACVIAGIGLLCFAFEGLICILMLAPFALTLAGLGALVGYRIQPNTQLPRQSAAMMMLLTIFPPLMIGMESRIKPPSDEFMVRSSVIVNAPPEVVWKNVVSFSELPEPTEAMFKSGIAYPMRAEIVGSGVGAVRYCVFSTGPFIEPITIWDEPHLLEFSVRQVPAPMHELSPYPGLHPPHLDGFFVSRKGHFVLTALPGGRTRLEGTTWYTHNLWPETYWAIWSDVIIHRIHLRVLNHVKQLSENGVAAASLK